MPSDGVRLIERLRLGERPLESDWRLAAAIVALKDASANFLVACNDLIDDRDNAHKHLRFLIRIQLLALASERLAEEIDATNKALTEYFDVRAEDEADEDGGVEGKTEVLPEAPIDDIRNEISAVLGAGGFEERDAKVLGDLIETVRFDCSWFRDSLTEFVNAIPDVDKTLDFCSDIEARFVPDSLKAADGRELGDLLRTALNSPPSKS